MHGTGHVPSYWIFQIIRQYLSWPKFSQVICCHCYYTWDVQLIRTIFHLDISFACWFRVICLFFYVLWYLHSWRSWWSRRHGVRRYHNGWCADTFGGLFEHVPVICLFHRWDFFWETELQVLGLLSSSAGLIGFPIISQMKGIFPNTQFTRNATL